MSIHPLQRFSARIFDALRQFFAFGRRSIQARPWLSAWFYPIRTEEDKYREHNGRMFADFHEQERMLADRPRMAFYEAMIARHIKPGDRVVDLGTGTGILAALAARQGAAQVYAIDHSDILKHARTLADANRIENVEFIPVHSSAFELDEPVDVILHEQMGDCLFDEGMVANVTDLRDRMLKPGGLILPSRFELYCEPVKISDGRHVPFIWELEVCGYDYACLRDERPQNEDYYSLFECDPGFVDTFLCKPEPVMTLDLQTVDEMEFPFDFTFSRTVVHSGRLDGYAVYFRAMVDEDLVLSSDPTDPGRAPHWGVRLLRIDQDDLKAGDTITTRITALQWSDRNSWRWYHLKNGDDGSGLGT